MTRATRARANRILIVASVVAACVSCTVGPDYVRPPVAVPPAYKEAADATTQEPRTELPRSRWWEIYRDAELNSLVAQVDVNNQTIRAAEARVRQAQALTAAARAPSFVSLNAGGSNEKLGLVAGWEVDLWGRIRRSVEASTAAAESTADELEAAKLSIQAQLAQNYFLLRVQDAEIRLLQDSIARYERSLQLTRNQYAVGVASRGDIVQAEAQLNSTRAQAFDADVTRAQLEHAIAVLIGKPPADFSLPPTPLNPSFPAVPPALPSELLERRPDIAAAERRMAAANAQIGVAEAAFYPSVRLFAGGGFDINFAGGAALAQYLLDGGLRKAQSAQVTAAYEETVANYRQTILSAFREVEDNLAALRILENEAAAQGAAVKAARESVTITNNQYRAGIVNYLSVVVVQAAALINERAELNIIGRRLVASVALIKALGGGWQAEPPQKSGISYDPFPPAAN
jgi:NodT family efflux transporter outer membrane factor (OMF) lipoprotein